MDETLPRYLPNLILRPVISALKNQEAVADADHENLWIELGWDICEGDGRLVEHARSLLDHELRTVPEILKHRIWWLSHGSVSEKSITRALVETPGDYREIPLPDYDEFEEEVHDVLASKLFKLAEATYEEWEERQPDYDESFYASSSEHLREISIRCCNCDWKGLASATEIGKQMDDDYECYCPNCGDLVGYLAAPESKETVRQFHLPPELYKSEPTGTLVIVRWSSDAGPTAVAALMDGVWKPVDVTVGELADMDEIKDPKEVAKALKDASTALSESRPKAAASNASS